MAWGRPQYDRRQVLEQAAADAARGRRRRAIEGYRRVLVNEPANPELHQRLAPLLAKDGQAFDAWLSFRTVAQAHLRHKKLREARDVWRQAAEALPDRVDAWLAVARAERRLGHDDAALHALLAGRRRMRRRRAEAIHLLRQAHELRPWDPDVVIDLARLLARSRQRAEAEALLEELARRSPVRVRRRVRRVHWRIAPSLGTAWLWLRAA
jgi:tetratricopeptide (TPR) repeat protein